MSLAYTNCPYCMEEMSFYDDNPQQDGSFNLVCPNCNRPFSIAVGPPVDVVNHITSMEDYDTLDPNSIPPEVSQFILDALDPSTPNTAPVDADLVIPEE